MECTGFFQDQYRKHNMMFALNASVLKCSYGALYAALKERFVSDLSASVEHEIMKDGPFG